ncbi:MAG: GGDEF domain-containing protein [Clostridiaceae bacterium]|nr:GGDEF domain-containing protein [Clostridiaceae bacterium]
MTELITLTQLQKDLTFFQKMYDAVRLVDPIRKKVMESRLSGPTSEVCYNYWGRDCICENCISMRAFNENRTFMKLEHSSNAVMLVTAMPIEHSNHIVVLEFLKNTTDTMMIGTGEYNKGQLLFNAVHDLNNLVIRDALTSLYNKRFLDDRLPADIDCAVVNQNPLSVIFIDIDNMKAVNDAFGHVAGDQILKLAAITIKGCVRDSTDWVARYGGDEFFVCLNNTDHESALDIFKKINNSFKQISFDVQGNSISVKVSQGVVTMPTSGMSAEEIIQLADRKMYEVKRLNKIPIQR